MLWDITLTKKNDEDEKMFNQKYNGWSNYETWNANLWIEEDQNTYCYWTEIAKKVSDAYSLAMLMKDEYEMAMPDMGYGMFRDLLTYAVSNINWVEIAEYFKRDTEETDNE